MSTPERPTVICAWCRRLLESGGASISHGLCPRCLPAVLGESPDSLLASPPARAVSGESGVGTTGRTAATAAYER